MNTTNGTNPVSQTPEPDRHTLIDIDMARGLIALVCDDDEHGRWLDRHAELVGVICGLLEVTGHDVDDLDADRIDAGRRAAIHAEVES